MTKPRHRLNTVPHGVALIKISNSPSGCFGDIEEFYGVFFRGDFVDGKFDAHHKAQLAFDELQKQASRW